MRLRDYRRQKLISIEELAKETGMSTRTIVDAERGRTTPRMMTIRRLCAALEIEDPMSIDEFRRALTEDDEDESAAA